MYCKHCGKQIEESSTFCKYCGQKIEGTADQPSLDEEKETMESLATKGVTEPKGTEECKKESELVDISEIFQEGEFRCPCCSTKMSEQDDYFVIDGSDVKFWELALYYTVGIIWRYVFNLSYEKQFQYKVCPSCGKMIDKYRSIPYWAMCILAVLTSLLYGAIIDFSFPIIIAGALIGALAGLILGKIIALCWGLYISASQKKKFFMTYDIALQNNALVLETEKI